MTSFKRKISTVALAASIALISGTAAAERGVTDTSIKIGNIGPFSGKAAMFNPLNYGSVAYMRYINDMGGVYGRKFDIKLGDTACAQAKGIAAAKKMVYDEKVFMITVNPCSGVAMAVKPTLEKEGVPWSGVSANPKITGSIGSGGKGMPCLLYTSPSPRD